MFYMLFMHRWPHYERTFMVMPGLSPVTYLSIRVVPDSNLCYRTILFYCFTTLRLN